MMNLVKFSEEESVRIVIEGPDGAGKSNLIDRFRHAYPSLMLMPRACTSDNGPIEELGDWVEEDLLNPVDPRLHRLYDRHPLVSELIYSPALGRPLNEIFQRDTWLIRMLKLFNTMNYAVIYCLPSKERVHDNILRTHSAQTDHVQALIRNIDRVYDMYYVLWCAQADSYHRFRWDYANDEWHTFCRQFDRSLT